MKINWGTALLIFFILYIGNIVRVVINSSSVDHSLVVENYYDHDIYYQAKLDKISNRKLLAEDLVIEYGVQEQKLSLSFGKTNKTRVASIQLYRASDKYSDIHESLNLKNQEATFDLRDLAAGKWKVKVEWQDQVRSYLKEQDIYIQ